MGCVSSCNQVTKDVKKYIMDLLEKSKKGIDPRVDELNVILSNIDKLDHHDFVRTDQILTRRQNKLEQEYQWGSIITNCKWKIL